MSKDKWLKTVVAEGLARLVILGLPNRPAEETIKAVAATWVQVLQFQKIDWNEAQDRERLERAFMQLCTDCDKFPNPKMLLDRLAKRKAPQALPPPILTAAQREKNKQRLAELREFLKCSRIRLKA